MKQCPMCDTNYPDEHTTCTTDGAVLLEIREWEPGKLVRAKYRVLAKVGQGGMGVVYKATHIVFEEVWALKVMATRLAADPKFVRRFRQEAQVTRKLQHINTVRVQDFDQAEDGSPFIVMEFIEGVSLQQLLQAVKGPLPVARALWIARGIAEGLSAAHGLGLVHRDIKPANIHVGRLGLQHDFVKVLDFGLVKSVAGANGEHSLATAAGLTPGTPAYMAPEMALGDTVDGRADLYALGCVSYYLLTGAIVFDADTGLQMIAKHLRAEPVPPSQRTALPIPAALERLVLACLAKKPEDRPQSAAELARSLSDIEGDRWSEERAAEWWTANSAAS
jgi:serine/threonine protein kinase